MSEHIFLNIDTEKYDIELVDSKKVMLKKKTIPIEA